MAEIVKNPVVNMSTSKGDIRIELDAEKAPISTQNFLDYVNAGHYDGRDQRRLRRRPGRVLAVRRQLRVVGAGRR